MDPREIFPESVPIDRSFFSPVLFSFPIALYAENACYDGENGTDLFVFFDFAVYFLHYSDVEGSCHRTWFHLYVVFFFIFAHNVNLKYYPMQLRVFHPYVCVLHQIV